MSAKLNVEVKARCGQPDGARAALRKAGAESHGIDRQVDTYFHVPRGRLKLREGDIETALIHYLRSDDAGARPAAVTLYQPGGPTAELKAVLTEALGVRVVVEKRREIYFIENVKFHVDRIEGLGAFVEIEAIDAAGTADDAVLRRQCETWMEALGIAEADLVARSYSDLVEERRPGGPA